MRGLPDRHTATQRALRWLHRCSPGTTERIVGTVIRVSTPDPVVALTFDDGPCPSTTPRLLELLEAHRARATFFMLGKAAAQHPALVRVVAAAGHAIGNHSWDHPSFPAVSSRHRRAQIRACARAIAPYGARLFRPPFGDLDIASRLDVFWMRHNVIAWDVDTGDWRDESPGIMVYRAVTGVRAGSIVLLHDGSQAGPQGHAEDRAATLKALDLMLRRLRETYTFVTVPELLRRGRPRRVLWVQQADRRPLT